MSSLLDERYREQPIPVNSSTAIDVPSAPQSIGLDDRSLRNSEVHRRMPTQLMDVDVDDDLSDSIDVLPTTPVSHKLSATVWIFLAFVMVLFTVWCIIAKTAALVMWLTLMPLAGALLAWWRNRRVLPLDEEARAIIKGEICMLIELRERVCVVLSPTSIRIV